MAYAKLSGSLLVRKETPLAESVSAPRVGPTLSELATPAPPPATPTPPLTPAGEPSKLLAQHLKALKLPTFLGEYDKLARQAAVEGLDHSQYLLRLAELELIERKRRMIERRIKTARFPAVKGLDSYNFAACPSLDRELVLELGRGGYVARRENVILIGASGTGKTHIALGLGLAACQQGSSVGFVTAASLMRQLLETHEQRRLIALQRRLAACKLLIVDELGYVPLSPECSQFLFEIISERYERGSTIVTSNLPLDQWTSVFGSPQLASVVLERLTHHAHILEMNSESYRVRHSAARRHGNGFNREDRAE